VKSGGYGDVGEFTVPKRQAVAVWPIILLEVVGHAADREGTVANPVHVWSRISL